MDTVTTHDPAPSTTAGSPARRRPRDEQGRPHTIRFDLSDEEFSDLRSAARRAGLAKGAYAAEAALSSARGLAAEPDAGLRDALQELIHASGLVRKIGVLLNQAVAKLNATGQAPGELDPCVDACRRRMERLDDAAEQVRRALRLAPGSRVPRTA
jgi:hypothetical protein